MSVNESKIDLISTNARSVANRIRHMCCVFFVKYWKLSLSLNYARICFNNIVPMTLNLLIQPNMSMYNNLAAVLTDLCHRT